VLKKASRLFAAKGKKVVEVDLKKTDLTEEEILKLVLGPTGNLRAPTLLVGKKMVVGFNQEMYESVFG
jgi:arsenate reductase-like glutaredoxin family protein